MLSLQRTARHVREARALDRGDSSFHRSRGVMHTVLYCTVLLTAVARLCRQTSDGKPPGAKSDPYLLFFGQPV
jgi:hypothetical protein